MKIAKLLLVSCLILVSVVGLREDVSAAVHETACDDNHPSQGVFFTCHYFSDDEVKNRIFKPIDKISGDVNFGGVEGIQGINTKILANGRKFEVTVEVTSSFPADGKIALKLDNGYVAVNKNEPGNNGRIKFINLTSKPSLWAILPPSSTTSKTLDDSNEVPPVILGKVYPPLLSVSSVCRNALDQYYWVIVNNNTKGALDLIYRTGATKEKGRVDVAPMGSIELLTLPDNNLWIVQGTKTLLTYTASNVPNCSDVVEDPVVSPEPDPDPEPVGEPLVCDRPEDWTPKQLVFPVANLNLDTSVYVEESIYGNSYIINLKSDNTEGGIPTPVNILF